MLYMLWLNLILNFFICFRWFSLIWRNVSAAVLDWKKYEQGLQLVIIDTTLYLQNLTLQFCGDEKLEAVDVNMSFFASSFHSFLILFPQMLQCARLIISTYKNKTINL